MNSRPSPDAVKHALVPPRPRSTPPVRASLNVWPGGRVQLWTFIIVNTPAPLGMPGSLPASPPGSDGDDNSENSFAARFLHSDGDEDYLGFRRSVFERDESDDEVHNVTTPIRTGRENETPDSADSGVKFHRRRLKAYPLLPRIWYAALLLMCRRRSACSTPSSHPRFRNFPNQRHPAESVVSKICSQLRDDVLTWMRVRLV
eukprot:2063550-Pleurochrysis_carterae.AAC.2